MLRAFYGDPNLDFYIDNKYRCRFNALNEIKQEFLKRIVTPIYIPIIALISCLLLLKSKDQPGFVRQKILVFILSIILIIFSEIITRYAGLNYFVSLIFSITPVILWILTYFYLKLKITKNVY